MLKAILLAFSLTLGNHGTTLCDQHFLDVLRAHDIRYITPEWAIWDAHEVCVNYEAGQPPEQIAQVVMSESGMDGYHAGFFVGASIGTYCPPK